MPHRFRDYQHVLRIAAIFVVAIVTFLAWRSWMVPADFGKYGHFRAGALDDAMRRPVAYAGQAACVDCHSDVAQVRQSGRHAKVACEACHGPLSQHAAGEGDKPVKPQALKLCPVCHSAGSGKPKAFPQVDVREHMGETACTECHTAHSPHIS
jgi:hypothetical protein